ncbi:MAG TPA: hypothetical protein VNZ62_09835 [Capillimicrobium sp.]|nr:hypothetical protein [Capillimicrobium sp.]
MRRSLPRPALAALLATLCAAIAVAAPARADDDGDRLGPLPGGWSSLPAISPEGDDDEGVPTFARIAARSGRIADAPIDRRVRAQPQYAPLGDVSRSAAGDQPVALTSTLSGDEARSARAAALGALALAVAADPGLRAGGGGRLSVALPAQLADAPAVADVRASIRVPRAYRVGEIADGGWRCRAAGRAIACRAPGRATAGTLDEIGVGLVAVRPGAPARVRVRASWDQDGAGRRTASATLRLRPRPPVRVHAVTARRTVLAPTSADAAPVVLTGRLKGRIDGTPLRYRWRQVSGPRATIVDGASGVATTSVVTAHLRLPQVTRPQTLRFRLSARDVRGTGAADLALRVLPATVARLDPRLEALTRVRALTPPQRRLRGHRVGAGLTRAVRIEGGPSPRAGQVARLRAVGVGGAVGAVRWTVRAGGDTTVRRGEQLVVRLPRSGRHVRVDVRAEVGGARVAAQRTLHLRPAAPQPRAVARAAQADADDDDGDDPVQDGDPADDGDDDATAPDDADEQEHPGGPFCRIFDAVKGGDPTGGGALSLASGTTVTLGGASASGGACDADGAKVAFDAATVRIGVLSFEDVTGEVDADGMMLTGGTVVLPDVLRERLGSGWSASFESAGLYAALEDGEWQSLTGRLALHDGIPWIALPEGWEHTPSRTFLTLRPGAQPIAVHSEARPTGVEAAEPGAPTRKVAFDGSIASDATIRLHVAADKVVQLQGVDDTPVFLSGEGEIEIARRAAEPEPAEDEPRKAWGWTGSIALKTDPADRALAVTDGLTVSGVTATWDADGIALGAVATVDTADGPFVTDVAGTFTSRSQWKLTVTQKQDWTITDDVVLTGIEGSIERRPAAQDDEADDAADDEKKPADVVVASLRGTVTGWSPSSSIADVRVTGELGNRCADDEKDCSTDRVQLRLDVTGTARIPTVPDPLAWEGHAVVTLRTMALRFTSAARLPEFGPEWLALKDIELTLSNQAPNWCVPKTPAPAPGDPAKPADAAAPPTTTKLQAEQGLTLGFSAGGQAFDQPIAVYGQFSAGGYCLAAQLGAFDPTRNDPSDDSLIRDARLLYASTDVEIKPDPERRPLPLAAGELKIVAAFRVPAPRLPESLRDSLAGTGDLTATLTRTRGEEGALSHGFAGKVVYTFAKPSYVIGAADDPAHTALALRGATLSVDYSPRSALRIALAADADLTTPATQQMPASTTPLALTASISLGSLSVGVSAAVDAARAPDGVVRDAFGERGLDVRSLQLAGEFGASSVTVGLSADATLPAAWTASLGVQAQVRAAVALKVAAANPCLEISVDARDPARGSADQAPPAIVLGPVAANYARIAIAPTGCTIGAGTTAYTIDPGIALAFDGTIATTPVKLAAKLARQPGGGFRVQADADVGAFAIGSAQIEQTHLRLDLDSAARRYVVELRGGLRVGDSFVTVDGAMDASPQRFAGHLKGAGELRLSGTSFGRTQIDATVDAAKESSWKLRQLSVDATVQVLGLGTDVAFAYADGKLENAAGALEFRGSVGPAYLSAGGLVVYRPDGARLSGDGCRIRGTGAVQVLQQAGGQKLYLRLCGDLRLGPLGRGFTWTESFPKTIDFDLTVPRMEVGVYVGRVFVEGALQSSLVIDPAKPRFYVRGGYATAGGCIGWGWLEKCGTGVNVRFNPSTGRFEGTFLGVGVRWGSDEWRT